MKHLASLHYRNNLHFIGDVHPFYDTKNEEWFLYYLQPGGQFNSLLVKSKNLFSWKDSPISFKGSPRAKYYVVAISKYQNVLYSWYGQQSIHVCSKSSDGLIWEADPSLDILVNKDVSRFGERDPYIVYDKQKKCFFAVALAYLNSMVDCAITLKKTQGADLHTWEEKTTVVLRFPNGDTWTSGEPECPQLIQINHRWYIFASLAHKTTHHVGGLSYWIGDIDKSPDEVDWSSKTRYMLTSEDLCAAQLVQKNQSFHVMGWIPQDYHGAEWGGNVNIPLVVKARPDGKLATAFDGPYLKSLEKKTYASADRVFDFEAKLPRSKASEIKAKIGMKEKVTFSLSQVGFPTIDICFDSRASKVSVVMVEPHYECASIEITNTIFKDALDIDIIAEKDMVEININKAYTLHARVGRSISGDVLTIGRAMIHKIEINALSGNMKRALK